MGRRGLQLGEHGEIETTPQVRVDGRWVATDQPRRAQRHRARVYYMGFDGVRREVSTVGRTKPLALAALDDRLAQRMRGASDAEMTSSTPLVVAGAQWLARIERTDSGLSPATVEDYRGAFMRHVDVEGSSVRGLTLAQANDPQRMGNFLRSIADRRGTGAAKMTRSALSGIFNLAVENGVLSTNALRQVRAVKSQTPKPDMRDHERAFTREERDAVIAHADAMIPDAATANPRTVRKAQATADLLAFMAGTGARIDEAREIQWNDLDLASGSCRIRGTKSDAADRAVNLPTWLLDRMSRRAECVHQGYVFGSPAHVDGGSRWDQSNSSAAVRRVLDDAGMDWAVPHTFRRTVATLLHGAGAPLVRIADQLGHSDPAMTARVYLGRDFIGDKSDLAAHL